MPNFYIQKTQRMKKLMVLALGLLLSYAGMSQTTAPAKADAKKATTAAKTETAKATAPVKADASKTAATAKTEGTKLKADGTPDKRYKENKHLKADGTPDKRYKENKDKKN